MPRAKMLVLLAVAGCGSSAATPSDAGNNGSDAATPDTGASAAADAGSSADSGSPRDGGARVVGGCPRVLLGNALPAEYSGDTTSLPNLVTSARLEWKDAPDDALELTAPVAGKYVIELTSTVMSLGASAKDYNTNGSDAFPFTRAGCPAAGAVKEINGIYNDNQPDFPITLAAGQSMVIFVSTPYWAAQKAGPYTLRVRKLP